MGHKSFQHRAAAAVSAGPATVVTGDQVYVTNSALQADPGSATVARFGARGMTFPSAVLGPRAVSSTMQTKGVGSIDRYRVAASGEMTMLDRHDAHHPFGIATSPGRTNAPPRSSTSTALVRTRSAAKVQ